MKLTNSKICKFFIILFTLNSVFLYGCNKKSLHLEYLETVDEVITKINNAESEINYEDYLNITLNEPEIISDVSDGLSPDTNYVSENIIIKNISKYPIKLKCKVYLPNEMINTIAYAPTTFEISNEIVLKPQKQLDMAAAIIMKKSSLMTTEELNIFNKYSRIVYIECIIDGKYFYIKQEC